jgi:hypothetical protein
MRHEPLGRDPGDEAVHLVNAAPAVVLGRKGADVNDLVWFGRAKRRSDDVSVMPDGSGHIGT